MTTVAVVGAGRPLGVVLARRFDREPHVRRIVGVDVVEPEFPAAKLEFRRVADDSELADALTDVDVVVALAGAVEPDRDPHRSFVPLVRGTRALVEAMVTRRAPKLVHVSSAVVYGARADNPVPLDESSPPRAAPACAWAYQLRLSEEIARRWAAQNPATSLTVLRPALMLGGAGHEFLARHLCSPRLLFVRGASPAWQFVDADDVAAAVARAATTDMPGTYNVAADGWLSSREVSALLGRRPVVLPEVVATEALRRLWDARLSALPAPAVDHLLYPVVVEASRLEARGWAPTRTNRDILRQHAREHRGVVCAGGARIDRSTVRAAAVGAIAVMGMLATRRRRQWRCGE